MSILNAIIIILGFSTSYTDIKFHRIKNSQLLNATVLGVATYIYLIATHQITPDWNLLWNVLIGAAIGLTLYFTDCWGAGDAKLFAVFCLLMPVHKYDSTFFFPSIAIFANIFLLSFLAMLVLAVIELIQKRDSLAKKISELPAKEAAVKLAKSFLIILCLKWMIEAVISHFLPGASHFLNAALLLIAYRIVYWSIEKLKYNSILFILFGAGIIARFAIYGLDTNISDLATQIKTVAIYTLLFGGFSIIFDLRSSDHNNTEVIPFAPLMLVGTLLTHTDLLNWITQLFLAANT